MESTRDHKHSGPTRQVATVNGHVGEWPPRPSAPPLEEGEIATGAAKMREPKEYALSSLRWPLLVAVCTFGFCNGFANEHSVILNVYVESLDMELADYINLYQAFFFVPMVASFLAANLVDNCGLKLTVYAALLMALVRNGTRILLFSPQLAHWRQLRLVYWLVMRGLTQMNFAFYICFPMKLAESWFPDTERSFAWSISNGAPTLGVATASLLLPHLVQDLSCSHWVVWFNAAAIATSALVIFLGVRRSEPAEGPPSLRNELTKRHELRESSAQSRAPGAEQAASALRLFGRQVVRVLRNGNLMIQLLVINTFDQLLLVIVMVLQDIFKGAGLSGVFTGQFMASQIFVAIAIQTLVSTKLKPKGTERDPYNTRVCKCLVLGMLITFVLFAMSLVVHELDMFEHHSDWLRRHQWLLVSLASLAFVAVHNLAKPFLTEQTGELICGVVSEANSSAFLSAMSAVVFNVCAFIFVRLRQLDEPQPEETPTQASNFSAPMEQADFEPYSLSELDSVPQPGSISDPQTHFEEALPLYFRPIMFICCVALTSSLIYLISFDSSSEKRRERMRQLQRARQQSISGWTEPREQVVEIELTKL